MTSAQERTRILDARPRPVATYVIAATVAAAFVAAEFVGNEAVFGRFAKINERIWAGEIWRLLTPMFLHAGLLHLSVNVWALLQLGPTVESFYGRWRFVVFYFGAGVAGSLASLAWTQGPSVGASAGLFGLFGALVVLGARYGEAIPAAGRKRFWIVMVINLGANVVLGAIIPRIDNAAHAGGFVGGYVLALSIPLKDETRQIFRRLRAPRQG